MNELAISESDINVLTNILSSPTVPERYDNVSDLVATVLVGRELGLAPMTAINELFVVNGSVAMSGKAMLSLVRKAGHDVRVQLSTTKGTATALRLIDGELVDVGTFEFTQEDAETANLWVKDVYQMYPADMLAWKAVARAVRFCFSDVLLGYLPDELNLDVEFEALDEGTFVLPSEAGTVVEVLDAEEVADMMDGEVVAS